MTQNNNINNSDNETKKTAKEIRKPEEENK